MSCSVLLIGLYLGHGLYDCRSSVLSARPCTVVVDWKNDALGR